MNQNEVSFTCRFWDYLHARTKWPVIPDAKDHGLSEEDATWLKAYCQRELHCRRKLNEPSNAMRPEREL